MCWHSLVPPATLVHFPPSAFQTPCSFATHTTPGVCSHVYCPVPPPVASDPQSPSPPCPSPPSQTPSNSPPLHSWRIPHLDHTPRSSQLSSPPLLDPSTLLPPLPLPISFMPTALPLSEVSSWHPQDKTQFCTKTNGPPYSALQLGWAGRGEELQSMMGRQSALECRGLPGSPPHVLLQRGAHRGPRAPGTEVRWAGDGLKQPLPGQ